MNFWLRIGWVKNNKYDFLILSIYIFIGEYRKNNINHDGSGSFDIFDHRWGSILFTCHYWFISSKFSAHYIVIVEFVEVIMIIITEFVLIENENARVLLILGIMLFEILFGVIDRLWFIIQSSDFSKFILVCILKVCIDNDQYEKYSKNSRN